MRILIAGKRAVLRSALKTLLQTRPGIKIVAAAANKEELFRMCEAARPDLLLLDEDLDEAIIESIVAPVQALNGSPMVVILGGGSINEEAILEAGVFAYVRKQDPPRTLLTVLEEARLMQQDV